MAREMNHGLLDGRTGRGCRESSTTNDSGECGKITVVSSTTKSLELPVPGPSFLYVYHPATLVVAHLVLNGCTCVIDELVHHLLPYP